MQVPVKIDFQNMEPSEFVEKRVRERIDKLERFFDRLIGTHVSVEAPHHHHHKGNEYKVRVVLHVPGGEIVVSRYPGDMHAHQDVYVAIRDAFDSAERQLEAHAQKVRGEVKSHAGQPQGRVARLFAADGYGFITTTDGREVYFHRNSVVDGDFAALAVGDPVRLVIAEDESAQGPQASTVRPIGRMRLDPDAG
jgi:ribosomal subunit interface protein